MTERYEKERAEMAELLTPEAMAKVDAAERRFEEEILGSRCLFFSSRREHPVKVLVCGSRDWTRYTTIFARLGGLPRNAEILHGGARGADLLAARAAEQQGLTVLPPFLPDYEQHGRYWAPKQRNIAMLDEKPDLVIAFQRNESRGTQHTIDEARRRGIPVEVHTA